MKHDDLLWRLRANEVSRAIQLEAAEAIEWYRKALRQGEDLIGRLRELERDLLSHQKTLPRGCNDYAIHTIGEAADEIDRLREVISRMEVRNG